MQDNTINKIKYKIRKITEYPLVEIQDQIAIRPPKQKISPVVYQTWIDNKFGKTHAKSCLLYTSPSPRDLQGSRMPSSA